MKWKCFAVPICALLAAASCGTAQTPPASDLLPPEEQPVCVLDIQPTITPEKTIGSMRLRLQSRGMALYLDEATGEIAVQHLGNGRVWTSNPAGLTDDDTLTGAEKNTLLSQLLVSLVNHNTNMTKEINSRVSCVMNKDIRVEESSDSLRVIYTFRDEKLVIPITYRLLEDSLYVQIDTQDIEENGDFKIHNIALLPYFGAAEKEQEGYLVVPDGSGAVIRMESEKISYAPYQAQIYGKDYTFLPKTTNHVEYPAIMSVLGIQQERYGLLMMVEKGAAYARANAALSGQLNAYHHAYFDFDLRVSQNNIIGDPESIYSKEVQVYESGKLKNKQLGVRYFFTESASDSASGGYAEMALTVREYLIKQKGMAERADDPSRLYLDFRGAAQVKKPFLGIPKNTVVPLTTLNQVGEILQDLEKEGIHRFNVSYSAFQKDQLSGKPADGLGILSSLGSHEELQKLAGQVRRSGGLFFLGVDNVVFTSGGNGYDRLKSAAKDLNKSPAEVYTYMRDTLYADENRSTGRLLKPVLLPDLFAKLAADVPVDSGLYLETLTNRLYSDYADQGVQRDQTAAILAGTAEKLAKKEVPLLGNQSFFYALNTLDSVTNLPMTSSGFDILDESIPFYQIAVDGLLSYAGESLNTSGDFRQNFLKALETGSQLQFRVVAAEQTTLRELDTDAFFTACYSNVRDTILLYQRQREKIAAYTAGAHLVDHAVENEVSKSVYSNGVYLLVNHGETDGAYGEFNLGPLSYAVVEGGEIVEKG